MFNLIHFIHKEQALAQDHQYTGHSSCLYMVYDEKKAQLRTWNHANCCALSKRLRHKEQLTLNYVSIKDLLGGQLCAKTFKDVQVMLQKVRQQRTRINGFVDTCIPDDEGKMHRFIFKFHTMKKKSKSKHPLWVIECMEFECNQCGDDCDLVFYYDMDSNALMPCSDSWDRKYKREQALLDSKAIQIVSMRMQGKLHSHISKELAVSEKLVKYHIKKIRAYFHLQNQAVMIRYLDFVGF